MAMKTKWIGLLAAVVCLGVQAQNAPASLEEMLRSAVFKAIANKPLEIVPLIRQCADQRFRAANAERCRAAETADMINRLPVEMRQLMASERGAQSLRQLCLVSPAASANNFLCTELSRVDKAFGAQLTAVQQQQQQQAPNPDRP
jgi:hypothetical protein